VRWSMDRKAWDLLYCQTLRGRSVPEPLALAESLMNGSRNDRPNNFCDTVNSPSPQNRINSSKPLSIGNFASLHKDGFHRDSSFLRLPLWNVWHRYLSPMPASTPRHPTYIGNAKRHGTIPELSEVDLETYTACFHPHKSSSSLTSSLTCTASPTNLHGCVSKVIVLLGFSNRFDLPSDMVSHADFIPWHHESGRLG